MGNAYSSSEAEVSGFVPSAFSHSYFSDDEDDKSAYASDPEATNANSGEGRNGFFRFRRRRKCHHGSNRETNTGTQSREVEMALHLETKDSWVFCSKALVMAVLVIATTLLGVYTYRITSREQEDEFRIRFQAVADQVIEISRLNAEHSFDSFGDLSTTLTNWALGTNSTWPFVTFPEFESQAAHAMRDSQSSLVAVIPYVKEAQRERWEAYTVQDQRWFRADLEFRGDNETSQGINSCIHHLKQFNSFEYTCAGKRSSYAPVWQYAPVGANPNHVNYDLSDYDFFRRVSESIQSTQHGVISEVVDHNRINVLSDLFGRYDEDSTDHSNPITWPQRFMAYPIFNTHNYETRKVVGVVVGLQPWHRNMDNLASEGVEEIVVVVENSCSQKISYEIHGRDIQFMGYGDMHDLKYSHLNVTAPVTGFPHINDCQYSFRVYPSAEFEAAYSSRKPLQYTMTIVGVFLVTAFVFVFYDCLVERRQSLILSTARRSNQIVNSLFPVTVRDRLLVNQRNPGHQRPLTQEQAQPAVQAVTELVTGVPKAVLHAARNPSVLIPDLRTIPNRLSAAAPFITGGASSPPNQNRRGSKEWRPSGDDANYLASARSSGKPIADFFPFVSVMFSDIVGFTAWSSVREPFQVFTLLESVYNAFDRIAKKLRIFKVETIGDCYVAAAGLPDPRDDHAVVMSRFARACLAKMNRIVNKLERELGPGTGDLSMRVGIHSGAVTAGVLRGEKSRFQLFGDTVNTAARMESTGQKTKIQVSSETANLLVGAGKSHWVKPRETKVVAKGKGELQTYWLDVTSRRRGARESSAGTAVVEHIPTDVGVHAESPKEERGDLFAGTTAPSSAGDSQGEPNDWDSQGEHPDWELGHDSVVSDDIDISDDRLKRLVGWSVDVLQNLLKRIVAMRDEEDEDFENNSDFEEADYDGDDEDIPAACRTGKKHSRDSSDRHEDPPNDELFNSGSTTMVLEEVKEIITLPSQASKYKREPSTVRLSPTVVSQLELYVSKIATMYRENPFHCFEHASHVTQSVTKLMARVVTPDGSPYRREMSFRRSEAESLPATQLHEYTYGITSDPLTQFACAFAAIIHDVDHSGVPNSQLVKEESELAQLYHNKSVAEQNSVDLAWNMLMRPEYRDLRSCIYKTQSQLDRFRQLVVNSVMATDIADKELGALRKARWAKAFDTNSNQSADTPTYSEIDREKFALEDVNRKATIVIEHLIQASDVAHTMQHWYVYKKWNERFFHECYRAYLAGRAEKDPSEGWYAGELGFFDYYIIPLAQKLKECGVFGVASDEYLTYAMANRQEWELKGKETVQGYLSAYENCSDNGSVVSV